MIISSVEISLQLAILLPLIATVAIRGASSLPNLRDAISLLTSAALLIIVYGLYRSFIDGNAIEITWFELLPGLTMSFMIEPLGLIFALMASFLWLVTSVYSIGYMRRCQEQNQTRFYQFFAVAMATVMGIAFAANLFTLYIFYELLTLSTYPLVVHAGNQKAKQGGRVYIMLLLMTSILFLLLAVIGTWIVSGTLDFSQGGLFSQQLSLANPPSFVTPAIAILLPLFVFGIGKAAILPFHGWLPAAMVAPTPVSALLHAVAVVKGGVFTVLKICLYIFGTDIIQHIPYTQALLYLAAASVFLGSLIAMQQDNLKKLLAYSTISQLGYITIGALLANPSGIIGASMHMVIHGFGKITLFFCAGAILATTKITRISELRGLGRDMPITMGAFFIASLSIIGLPPTAGMWSKWFLLNGTIESEQWLLMIVLALSSLMSLFYLLPISIRAFSPPAKTGPKPKSEHLFEAPITILAAICVSTAGCLVLFLFPQPLYELAAALVPVSDPMLSP